MFLMEGYRLDAFRVQQGSLLRLFCHRASLRKKCLLGTNSVCNCKEILVFARSAARLNTRQQRPAKRGAQHRLRGDRADATREEPCTAEVSSTVAHIPAQPEM